ncbi:hypothetical protein GCM10010954_12810 [Halobacillus andaensis]|uniref:Hydrolase n=1 Tax=Halobacillus andaensis TaxID=1176239 RepID=A0A917B396_HALAA|nr:HAD family hydrolase [Halobacillus andaensis]MBP2004077.1 putative hydrolase of the HAD superfamily [Halobacillus andaensis]GGF15603.1 hypothetical protein GCM10010954_12810 [Halobacillus andaensis]
MFDQVKCIIFDLDGTLYEDIHHFEYYANQLKEKLSYGKHEAFEEDYIKVLQGEHPLSIGKAYDLKTDAILTVDPYTNLVVAAKTWKGEPWTHVQVAHHYPEEVSFDFENIIAIGDGWWLPFSIAVHHGLSLKDCYESYVQTKDFMVSDQFALTKTRGLKRMLGKWKQDKTLILLTNSESYDVVKLLDELQLNNIFDEIIVSAQKPSLTKKHFTRILQEYELFPEEVVSVGDNFMNEIAPALILNMKALLIQTTPFTYKHPNLQVVSSLTEVIKMESIKKRSDSQRV